MLIQSLHIFSLVKSTRIAKIGERIGSGEKWNVFRVFSRDARQSSRHRNIFEILRTRAGSDRIFATPRWRHVVNGGQRKLLTYSRYAFARRKQE